MIGGFRKNAKRGNLRKKVIITGSDEEEGEVKNAEQTQPLSTIVPTAIVVSKEKIRRNTSKTTLSFGDEMENDNEFVVRKSKASINLQDQIKNEKKRKKKKENIIEEKESLTVTHKDLSESKSELQIKTFNDEDDSGDDSIGVSHRFNLSNQMGIPGTIPDAATIYAMKKKREQARQFSGQVAYIPLNLNKHEGRFSSSESRLVREDMDNDSSGDERIEMKGTGSKSHPALERRKQVAKALEEVQDESDQGEKELDDDGELQRWENEQIKKGSKMPTNQPESYGPKIPDSNSSVMIPDPNSYSGEMPLPALPPPPAFPMMPSFPTSFSPQMFPPQMSSIPNNDGQYISVELVAKKLKEQLDTKTQLIRLHERQREKTNFDLASSKENIVTLERKAADASDRFTFYQDICGFMRDLIECLSEKVKKINDLEASMHQTLKKNAERLVTRRQNDVKDEADEIGAKPNTQSDRISNIKNRRIAEREGRRARRREDRRNTHNMSHNEGMSSDDEMISSDSLRFESEKGKILKDAENIFDDVISDFTSIREISSRFEQWKFGFNDSYKEAYLGLCLPKLFTPFIKLELLNWNPLELEHNVDFEDMNWFCSLALYGNHGGEPDDDDDDLMLLPNIIEKVLIPKLTVLMRDVWDPMSTKQTKLTAFLFQRLVDDSPTITKDSKETKVLVETIVTRLKTAVETEIYIPLYPHTLLESKNSPTLAFLERQFWKGVKLLSNLMEWNWLLSQKKLQQLGIDAILNRYLVIALQQFPDPSLCLDKAKKIVNVLPKEWFEKSDQIVPGLESFSRFLVRLATSVYKSLLESTGEYDKKKMKITIKKIISLLMHIQAFDEARSVANNCKDDEQKDTVTPVAMAPTHVLMTS